MKVQFGVRIEGALAQSLSGAAVYATWRASRFSGCLRLLFRTGPGGQLGRRWLPVERLRSTERRFEHFLLLRSDCASPVDHGPCSSADARKRASPGLGTNTNIRPAAFILPAMDSASCPYPQNTSPRAGPRMAPPVSCAMSSCRNG